MANQYSFETLRVQVLKPYVYNVELNRPDKMNAMNPMMWTEIRKAFQELHEDKECRVIILSGSGKLFTAGLDLKTALDLAGNEDNRNQDVGRRARELQKFIKLCQESMTQLELCLKPVLVAIHSGCIGGGTSLITAADVRYCTKDAWFQIKEVTIGIVPDVGIIQRMQKIIGCDSLLRELCYTGRKFSAAEALSCGLVSKVCDDKESLIKEILKVAEEIANNSPVAVQGIKQSIVFSRDHNVQDGLDQIARWNQFMFQCQDFSSALNGAVNKQTKINFPDY